MSEEKMEKEERKKPHKESKKTGVDKQSKLRKAMKIVGYIICLLMLIAGIMTGAYLLKLNVLPMKYMIVYGVVCLVLTLYFSLCKGGLWQEL